MVERTIMTDAEHAVHTADILALLDEDHDTQPAQSDRLI